MTKKKPTIFAVTDVETCIPKGSGNKGLVFDVAWKHIDRKGKEYGSGSYLAKDVVSSHTPYFKEKVGRYFEMTYKGYVEPVCFRKISLEYNKQVNQLLAKGHRVVFCAYNARFDCDALGFTSQVTNNKPFLTTQLPILCIWDYWSRSCPTSYRAGLTASGKFVKTSAEAVYAWEFNQPKFIESHVAWEDVEIEVEILLKVLARKKKMPIVRTPRNIPGHIYMRANKRLRFD